MSQTIIVALDTTNLAEELIAVLQLLQLTPETQIILCHVLGENPREWEIEGDKHQDSQEVAYQKIEDYLQGYQSQLPNSKIAIVKGDPAEEIIRLAHIHQSQLVVIGSRGLQGLQRIMADSVSSQVVEGSPCSVLVVKPIKTSG